MRAVIAEDSLLLREGVAGLLRGADIDVVGCCETADDLMLKVRSYSPDIAVVDIRLPPTHQDEGLQAALEIRTKHPSVGVLVLSQYVEVGLALKLFADSADGAGISSRTGSATSATSSARCVGSPRAARRSIRSSSRRSSPDAETRSAGALTPREREVLVLMAEGRSNQGIADNLVITLRAVEKYVSTIFGKLGLPSAGSDSRRVLAVLLYLRS